MNHTSKTKRRFSVALISLLGVLAGAPAMTQAQSAATTPIKLFAWWCLFPPAVPRIFLPANMH